ncbi:MAG: efflux RND transporter permease subunit, partial [Novosphingobium sp.]
MLQTVVAQSLSRRLLVLALALVVAVAGAWAFAKLPVDAYPDIAQTQVKI